MGVLSKSIEYSARVESVEQEWRDWSKSIEYSARVERVEDY